MGRSRETFGKKEVRNKKLKKRKDKAQRKLDKKEEGKKSLDDMIAYVDENGMITSTPPDPDQKTEVDVESIQIGVSRSEDEEESGAKQGTVSKYNDSKGYGFIVDKQFGESIFFHINDCLDDIRTGDKVEFEVEKGMNGLKAKNVSLKK